MTKENLNRRSIVAAATIATFLIFLLGVSYRVLASHLGAPVRSRQPMDLASLERFPLTIGEWIGQDVPLDEAIALKTGSDVYINRQYSRRDGLESVCLYLASGVRARTVIGHRPEICYIAAGWTLDKQRLMEITLGKGIRVSCSVLEFSRGVLKKTKKIVLNYFVIDGQYYGNIKELQKEEGRRLGMVDYAAQVQISSRQSLLTNLTEQTISDFAAASGLAVIQLFEDIAHQINTREKTGSE